MVCDFDYFYLLTIARVSDCINSTQQLLTISCIFKNIKLIHQVELQLPMAPKCHAPCQNHAPSVKTQNWLYLLSRWEKDLSTNFLKAFTSVSQCWEWLTGFEIRGRPVAKCEWKQRRASQNPSRTSLLGESKKLFLFTMNEGYGGKIPKRDYC